MPCFPWWKNRGDKEGVLKMGIFDWPCADATLVSAETSSFLSGSPFHSEDPYGGSFGEPALGADVPAHPLAAASGWEIPTEHCDPLESPIWNDHLQHDDFGYHDVGGCRSDGFLTEHRLT
jgi:hypothetical protein